MMKVTYILMQWPVRSETFAARDIRAAISRSINVNVLALKPKPENATELSNAMGVDHVPSDSLDTSKKITGIAYMLLHPRLTCELVCNVFKLEKRAEVRLKSLILLPSIFWCWKRIKETNPHIVHLFWGHYPAMLGWLLKRTNSPVKLSMFLGAYDLKMEYGLSFPVYKNADTAFTHVGANVSYLEKRGVDASKVNVIYRGIETHDLDQHVSSTKKPGKIIFVGRLIKEKNVELIFDVFKNLEVTTKELVIIGDGPELDNLKSRCRDMALPNVTFTGWLAPADVYKHMGEAEIFLFLSRDERLPNVIKEAMYLGAVTVTSNTVGIEELVTDSRDGYVVTNEDSHAIAKKLKFLLNHPDIRQLMAEKGREKIKSDFDVKANMKRYIDLWAKLK